MSKDEFFAFMPLLIYGIAISELVMHWRDYLKKERRYWPHLFTGLILLELTFLNFYYLYDKLDSLFVNYTQFLFKLLSPMVLLLTVSVYTPEDDRDLKQYFTERMSLIFVLIAVFIGLNMMQEFSFDVINLIRGIAVLFCLIIAYFKKPWMVYIFLSIRIAVFILEALLPQLFVN